MFNVKLTVELSADTVSAAQEDLGRYLKERLSSLVDEGYTSGMDGEFVWQLTHEFIDETNSAERAAALFAAPDLTEDWED